MGKYKDFDELFNRDYPNHKKTLNKRTLNKLQSSMKPYTSILSKNDLNEMLEFIDEDSIPEFLENLIKKHKKMPTCFDAIANVLAWLKDKFPGNKKDINGTFAKMLLFSLGYPQHDIDSTLKINDKHQVTKADMLALFKGGATFGTFDDHENFVKKFKELSSKNNCRWITGTKDAEEIVTSVSRSKTPEDAIRAVANGLGYDFNAIKNVEGMYVYYLNADALKKGSQMFEKLKPCLPNARLGNNLWIPIGFTAGGKLELVCNAIPFQRPFVEKMNKFTFKDRKIIDVTNEIPT